MMLLHTNLATNARVVVKLSLLLITELTYHASCNLTIYLIQANNTSPCPNEKLNV